MKLQSVANYNHKEQPTEPVGISITVPNQGLTPKEILERYTRNQPVPEMADYGYTQQDLSEFDHMDKFDRITAARKLKERIELIKKEAQTEDEKRKAEEAEKEYNEKFEQALNERMAAKRDSEA